MTATQTTHPANRARRLAALVFFVAALPTVLFGLRTYGSFLLLRSAYSAGAPKTSSIRPWMTLGYLAATYRVPQAALLEHLQLQPQTSSNTSLKSLAEKAGVSPYLYTQRVQRAIAGIGPNAGVNGVKKAPTWLGAIADEVLTALLVYGYPVLGLTLLLGAIGFPLPDGIATTIAGSLAAEGRIDWFWAAVVVIAASVLGDAIGYGLGRLLGQGLIERHGHWFGYTSLRRARVQSLFDRWGSLTVFFTRTFVSYLSSVASLLAGMSRYRLSKFLAIAFVGRLVWTAGYLGLGYGIGADWEAAIGFLTNLSILLLLLMVVIGSGIVASGRFVSFLAGV